MVLMTLIFLLVTLLVILSIMLFFVLFFFFQAEDGIRDLYVTGVQTCALPIFTEVVVSENASVDHYKLQHESLNAYHIGAMHVTGRRNARFQSHSVSLGGSRSEEHTSELQSRRDLVCRLLLEKKKLPRRPWPPS